MRTTRSRAVASHCIIIRVPVEIVTHILKFSNIEASELAAVAGTCRYLRAIASPLLLQNINFIGDKKSSFAPLEALIGNAAKGSLVRSLTIQEPKTTIASNRAVIYSNLLSQALDVLVHLTSLSIPFALLNQTVLVKIYNSSSIQTLSLSPAHLHQNNLDLPSRVAFPARQNPLLVTSLKTLLVGNSSSISTRFIANLLDFFTFHSIGVDAISLQYYRTKSSFGSFLTANPYQSLRSVEISLLPTSFTPCISWLTRVIAAQPSLVTLEYSILNFLEGFQLGSKSWVGWLDGNLVLPDQSFDEAWVGVIAKKLNLRMERGGADENFITSNMGIQFHPGTVLKPSHIQAIFDFEPCALTLSIAPSVFHSPISVCWSDWLATAALVRSHRYLECVSLFCSVTPITTVSNVISCSSSCYDTLLQTHPSLHAATELVGGYASLFKLSINLNLERLRALGDSPHGEILDVTWIVFGKEDVIVEYEGVGVEPIGGGTKKLVFAEAGETRSLEEKLLDCHCFVCGDGGAMVDPISAIRRCGVEEVRVALALGGFDLDDFDARPPTQPVDEDSFETFLRSTT